MRCGGVCACVEFTRRGRIAPSTRPDHREGRGGEDEHGSRSCWEGGEHRKKTNKMVKPRQDFNSSLHVMRAYTTMGCFTPSDGVSHVVMGCTKLLNDTVSVVSGLQHANEHKVHQATKMKAAKKREKERTRNHHLDFASQGCKLMTTTSEIDPSWGR